MSVERPDYVNLEYEVIVWCDYMEQVNKVVEQIVFFQGRSFGDRYKFVIKGDSYSFETMSEMGQDRITKANITLQTKAYIVPEYVGNKTIQQEQFQLEKCLGVKIIHYLAIILSKLVVMNNFYIFI